MKKQWFKLYYLMNTLIPGNHNVNIYGFDDHLICNAYGDFYMQHRYELYDKYVNCIIITDNEVSIYLRDEVK